MPPTTDRTPGTDRTTYDYQRQCWLIDGIVQDTSAPATATDASTQANASRTPTGANMPTPKTNTPVQHATRCYRALARELPRGGRRARHLIRASEAQREYGSLTAEIERLRAALVGIAQHRQTCWHCNGTGKEPGNPDDACHDCGGIGETLDATPALVDPDTCATLDSLKD